MRGREDIELLHQPAVVPNIFFYRDLWREAQVQYGYSHNSFQLDHDKDETPGNPIDEGRDKQERRNRQISACAVNEAQVDTNCGCLFAVYTVWPWWAS